MKLKLKVFDALCSTEVFVINGTNATYEDFGTKEDESPDTAEDYGCGNMTFTSRPATQQVLDKYKITVDEYNEICSQLSEKLSFGSCGWCV